MRLDKFANRGWVGHLIEGLEERRLLSGGSIFTLLTSGSTGAATILATDDRGAALAGFTAPVLPANPVGIAESGGDLFVLNGDGTVGEYTTSGAVVNASLISGVASPSAIAVSGSDIFIGDQSGPIIEYTTSGTLINGALTPGSDYYIGIAVAGSDLYVEDSQDIISEYTTAGAVVNESLASVSSTSGGQIVVSGSSLYAIGNYAIAQLTTTGEPINTSVVSSFNDPDSDYGYPVGFGVASSEIYVLNADGYLGEYTKAGALVRSTTLSTGHSYSGFVGMVLIPPDAPTSTASHLAVTVQPTDAGIGQTVVSPALTVAVENADGDLLTSDHPTVSISIASGPNGTYLIGTTSMQAVDGAAKFLDLYVSNAGTYTLSITDGSDAAVTTNSFTVSGQVGTQIFTSDNNYRGGYDPIGKFGTNGGVVDTHLTQNLGWIGNPAVSGADLFVLNEDPEVMGGDVESYDQGGVAEFTTSGEPINESLLHGLHDPIAMVMSESDFFILDSNGTIGEYTTAGATVNASLVTGLSGPVSLAISGSDLFVLESDGDLMKLGEYTTSGATVNATLAPGLPAGSQAIAVENSNLFIAESAYNQVSEYTTGGQPIYTSFISVADPTVIVTNGDELYVSSSEAGGNFYQYNSTGTLVQTFNTVVGYVLGLAVAEPTDSYNQIVFATQPTNVTGLQSVISPAITVQEFDEDGNLIDDDRPLRLVIASGNPTANLGGTVQVSSVNGIATFDDITVDKPGTYTLEVFGSDAEITSNSFTVIQPAAEVLVTTSSATYTVGEPITFTATVTGDPAGAAAPTATVEFVDPAGDVFSTEPIGVDGTAVWTTSFIAPGAYVVGAIYSGDAIYPSVGSNSTATEMNSTPISASTASFAKLIVPSSVIAGVDFKSNLSVMFTNAAAITKGNLTASLYIEPVGEVDGKQRLIKKVEKRITVKAGKGVAFAIPLTVLPADLAAGSYNLIAEVTDSSGAIAYVRSSQAISVAAVLISPSVILSAVTPGTILPGKTGSIAVALANGGNVVAKGVEIVVTTTAADGSVISLFSQNYKQTSVKPGKIVQFAVRFKVAKTMAAGTYLPAVQVMLDGVAVSAEGAEFLVG